MLAIRMQRTGRKGYPMYRVIVQEGHRQPTSGKVVANLGSYNPHTKVATLDKEKAATFLSNGAQPSDRVVKLLQVEKVELPAWVKITSDKKQKTIKHAEKLRRNQPKDSSADQSTVAPAQEEAPAEAEKPAEAPVAAAETVVDDPIESTEITATEVVEITESPVDETPAAEKAAEESTEVEEETVEVAQAAKETDKIESKEKEKA